MNDLIKLFFKENKQKSAIRSTDPEHRKTDPDYRMTDPDQEKSKYLVPVKVRLPRVISEIAKT